MDIKLRHAFSEKIDRTNEPGTCLWCGRKLRKFHLNDGSKGDYGDNAFCGLRCGYSFGVTMAELGKKLMPRK